MKWKPGCAPICTTLMTLVLCVGGWEIATSSEAHAADGFTAYNDLAWGTGQLDTNITTITSPNGSSGLPSSGQLIDFATGLPTPVDFTVTGGEFIPASHVGQGAEPATGTDAHSLFDGKVSGQGVISYQDTASPAGDLVLTFSNLDPSTTYDVAFYGHRNNYGYDRASLVTISGADAFTNQSSSATDNPNESGGVLFTGPTDPSTRMPADNDNGYVARFTEIDPGDDGIVVLTVSWDGTAGSEFLGKYGSAIRLVETATGTSTPTDILASVLPSSRSVQVNTTATAFASIVNAGTAPAIGCSLSPLTTIPATFSYQTTDPTTNALTGTPNTPVDIPAGAFQTFVFSLTPTAEITPTDVQLNFICTNTAQAASNSGLNTLLFSASSTPIPDIVALVAVATNDGTVHVPGASGGVGSTGVFAVASLNVGATGTMTVSANTGSVTLPVNITLCQTDTNTGACLAPPSGSVSTDIDANTTPSFGVFVEATGPVPFSPGVNRIFVQFNDQGGVTRGSTSVAVQTP